MGSVTFNPLLARLINFPSEKISLDDARSFLSDAVIFVSPDGGSHQWALFCGRVYDGAGV